MSNSSVLRAAGIVCIAFILTNAPTPLYIHWREIVGFGTTVQLSDHFGRRAVLLPSIGAAMAADAIFLVAPGVSSLMLARFLTGLCIGGIVSAGMANVVDRAEEGRKREASLMASVAMVLGAGLGPFIGGLFAQFSAQPIPWSFGIEMALLVLALLWTGGAMAGARSAASFWLRLPSLRGAHIDSVIWGIAFFGPGLISICFVVSLGPDMFAAALHSDSLLIAGTTAFGMFMAAVLSQFAARNLALRTTFLLSGLSTIGAMTALACLCLLSRFRQGAAIT